MKRKLAALALTTAALLVSGVTGYLHLPTPNPNAPAIVAPDEADVGELISLDYDARDVDWNVPGSDWRRVGDTEIVASFRQEGLYQVISAGVTPAGVRISQHYVHVGAVPAPTPTPEPVPDPLPDAEPSYFTAKAAEWAAEVKCPEDVALQLADNFTAAADESTDIDSLVQRTAELNRPLKGAGDLLGKIQSALLSRDVPDTDYQNHVQVWRDIASGLRNYAR